MQNKYLLNPAYGGLEGSLSMSAGFRSQWTDLSGSPKAQNITAHLPLYRLQGSAGIAIQNETSSDFKLLSLSGSYNYIIESGEGIISLGAKLGVHQVKVGGSSLRTPTGTYEGNIIDHNDPVLATDQQQGIGPQWGLGVYYFSDFLQIGIALDEFPTHTISVSEISFERQQLVSLFAQYDIYYSNIWSFSPSLLVKSDFVQTQIDIFGRVAYSNLFGGIGLRGYGASSLDALVILLGVQFNKHYRLSYSYDLGISDLRNYHDGSHEFTLNYNLQKLIGNTGNPKIIYNPRY
jgi:type IX secretion system PorP/SprF family membrane protein